MSMPKTNFRFIVAFFVVVVFAGAGIFLFQQRGSQTPQEPQTLQPSEQGSQLPSEQQQGEEEGQSESGGLVVTPVIVYTNSGFAPDVFRTQPGGTVAFVNQSSSLMWLASAVHPTHQAYPGSDIKKCDTLEAQNIFDACKGVASGQEWSFQFLRAGTWKYHNHLNPSHTGTIVVEQ